MDVGSDGCVSANFNFKMSTQATRNWEMKATQYECGDVNAGIVRFHMGKMYLMSKIPYTIGPPDCLQYFTESSGTVSRYVQIRLANAKSSVW